jgi:hypothetical protein
VLFGEERNCRSVLLNAVRDDLAAGLRLGNVVDIQLNLEAPPPRPSPATTPSANGLPS